MSEWATCSGCGRVLHILDRDEFGKCVICSPPQNESTAIAVKAEVEAGAGVKSENPVRKYGNKL